MLPIFRPASRGLEVAKIPSAFRWYMLAGALSFKLAIEFYQTWAFSMVAIIADLGLGSPAAHFFQCSVLLSSKQHSFGQQFTYERVLAMTMTCCHLVRSALLDSFLDNKADSI